MTIDFDALTLDGVTRQFGRRRALHGVSFTCRAGEVIGLVGPNGAGKSTLLAIVSTLLSPTSGAVHYGAHRAATAGAALRQRLGWLGHELQIYPELTARENLEFFARLVGVAEWERRVALALETARLADRADDPVASFSRGMRQRLALERALLNDPRLVLLDEPFTGLDQAAAEALTTRLRALAARGAIVLMATHDFDLADHVLDRAVILRDGRLAGIADGRTWRTAYLAALARPS
ncbi:MAG TPA: heme ABC exporter ATP-binding protein CcmA [Methylomirabilota bacterium]